LHRWVILRNNGPDRSDWRLCFWEILGCRCDSMFKLRSWAIPAKLWLNCMFLRVGSIAFTIVYFSDNFANAGSFKFSDTFPVIFSDILPDNFAPYTFTDINFADIFPNTPNSLEGHAAQFI